jgi:hypothetical protein
VQGQGPSSQARVSAIHVSLLHCPSAPALPLSLSPCLRFPGYPFLRCTSAPPHLVSRLPALSSASHSALSTARGRIGNRTHRATSRLIELYPIHEAFDVMEVLACRDIGELCEDLRAVALGDRMGQGRSLSEEESSQACVPFRRRPAATAWCPVRALPGSPRRANLGTGRKEY